MEPKATHAEVLRVLYKLIVDGRIRAFLKPGQSLDNPTLQVTSRCAVTMNRYLDVTEEYLAVLCEKITQDEQNVVCDDAGRPNRYVV